MRGKIKGVREYLELQINSKYASEYASSTIKIDVFLIKVVTLKEKR